MRKLILAAFHVFVACAPVLFGQRKPVTLDALHEFRGRPREVPGDPIWAPDGKVFAYRQGKRLMLYDVPSKHSREIAALEAMDNAALAPPALERNNWENRRVDEAAIQWDPAGRELLYATNGDLFLIDARDGAWRQITKTRAAERDPKFSPDGKRIGFYRGWDLYALDPAAGKETRLTGGGSETLRNGATDWVYPEELELGTAYWWSPDSRAIAYLQFDVSKEPLYPHSDLRGARAIAEPQRYPQAGENNPSVRFGVVAANGGNTKWFDVGDTVNRYLIARAGWTPDSKRVFAVRTNRIQNELEFLTFEASSGKASTIYKESDLYWVNVEGSPVFLKDGRRFVWTSERDGFRHLYLYSLDGGAPRQLTRGPWHVSAISGIDETASRIYYVSTEASPLERQLYAVALDGGTPRRITAGAGSHRVSMAPGCAYFLDVHSALQSPPVATLRTSDGAEIGVHRPADRRSQEEFEILPTEIVEVNNGGVTLYASLIKSAGFDASKKYPVIVNVYGGPHVQAVRNAWPGLTVDQVYAHAGYVVWQMDNRGTAGRGHAFESPVYRNLGAVELEDQLAGVRQLLAMGFADAGRIGVTGWSYGGFMTLNMLLNSPGVFRAGFAGAPVTNWLNYDSIYTERYMGLPKDNGTAYGNTALLGKAGNLKGALMLVHNLEDDNVLFQNSMQMIDALQSAGKQFEMMLYPQKSHGLSGFASRQMDHAMFNFFERHLKAKSVGSGAVE